MSDIYVVTYNEDYGFDGISKSIKKAFYNEQDAINYINSQEEEEGTWYGFEVVEIQ